jgi:hypothetical protein
MISLSPLAGSTLLLYTDGLEDDVAVLAVRIDGTDTESDERP